METILWELLSVVGHSWIWLKKVSITLFIMISTCLPIKKENFNLLQDKDLR